MPGRLGVAKLVIAALLLAVLSVACEPARDSLEPADQSPAALQHSTGVVLSIDSPALGRVDSFELLTRDGDRLVFDTTEMEFQSDFPLPHLAEHQVQGAAIEVTYEEDGDRLVVTRLGDAE